jgi:hypothetical protein
MSTGLTMTVRELLWRKLAEHPGHDEHDPVGRDCGTSRTGTKSRTVTVTAAHFADVDASVSKE